MFAGVCVLAGTQLAPMFDPDTFRRLVADLRRNDVRVIVDLCGEPLRCALDSGVDIVKLSHEEFVADGWAERSSVAAIADGIGRLHDAGAGAVVVSPGPHPRSPAMKVASSRFVHQRSRCSMGAAAATR